MADPKVLEAQRWVNSTYGSVPGYERCAETGVTGWAVMFSLTRALQHELGITALSDSFGPTTLAKLAERGDVSPGYTKPNIVRIAKYGLFCKGYSAGDTSNGGYDNGLYEAVRDLKSNIGSPPTATSSPRSSRRSSTWTPTCCCPAGGSRCGTSSGGSTPPTSPSRRSSSSRATATSRGTCRSP